MALFSGALPLLRAATDRNAVSGALDTPGWVNWGPPVRRPMLAHTRSLDAMATPPAGERPRGVLAWRSAGHSPSMTGPLSVSKPIARSEGRRLCRDAPGQPSWRTQPPTQPGATAALRGRQVRPCPSQGQCPRPEPRALAELVLKTAGRRRSHRPARPAVADRQSVRPLIQRRGRDLGGPSARAAFGGNLSLPARHSG
jgi:hypothetical protein